MEKKLLWVFLVALLVMNALLLVDRNTTAESVEALRAETGAASVKAKYAEEEESLVLSGLSWSPPAPSSQGKGVLTFVLVVSIEDCTNCIEDELEKLEELARSNPESLTEIRGYFVDEDRAEAARGFVKRLSSGVFPFEVRNLIDELPGASTPLVLVVDSQTGAILEAHKPIPGDLSKRDAFYERWFWVLDHESG